MAPQAPILVVVPRKESPGRVLNVERFRNEPGEGKKTLPSETCGRQRIRSELGSELQNRAVVTAVPCPFDYRKVPPRATRIDSSMAGDKIGKGPVTPFRATVAPFPAWRGSRFRVDRATRGQRLLLRSK